MTCHRPSASARTALVISVALVFGAGSGWARAHDTPARREVVALVEAQRIFVMIHLVVPDGNESARLDRVLLPGAGGGMDASRRALASRLLQPQAQAGLGLALDGSAIPLVLLRADVARRAAVLGGWEFRGTYRAELVLDTGAVHGLEVSTAEDCVPTSVDILIDESLEATSDGESLQRLGPLLMLPGASREVQLRGARRAAGAR